MAWADKVFTRTTKSSYRKEKKMSKTNTNTTRNQYVVEMEDAAKFLFKVDAEQSAVQTETTKAGNFLYHVKGFIGTITIQKSGRVVAKLNHKDFPHPCQEIVFVKRFSSKEKLMELAEELKDMVEDLRAKARKAKIAARQNKMDNNGEMPRPTKDKKPGLPTGVTGTIEKKHGKNRLGHIYGTIADELDNLFLSNATEEELLKAGYTPVRIKSHFRHLLKDKASLVDVKFENGQYFAKYID